MTHLTAEQLEALATSSGSDPHLASCVECSKAVSSAGARRSLLKGMKDLTLTEAAFRRVEAKVMSELQAPVSPWALVFNQLKSNWMLAAGVVAVALVVAVPRLLESKVVVAPVPVAVKEPVKSRAVSMLAVAVEGQVSRNGAALAAGEEVKTGDAVDARRGRAVLSAKADRFELTGEARFGGASTVALAEGVLAVDSGSEAVVEAGAWVVGTDAAFVITRAAGELVVELLRGELWVSSDSTSRDAVKLSAPARLAIPLPAHAPFGAATGEPMPYPFAAGPASPWARLDISDLPLGTNIDLDGQRFGGTPASVLLSVGKHKLRTHVPGQPSHESTVELVAGGTTRFKQQAPRVEAEKEEPPPSDEAIAEVQRAIKEQRPKLRACYEKWLKANPAATGQVELTLVLAKNGRVVSARVEDATIPQESIDCLVRTGKTLRLPALGSEQELQVPLVLTPGAGH